MAWIRCCGTGSNARVITESFTVSPAQTVSKNLYTGIGANNIVLQIALNMGSSTSIDGSSFNGSYIVIGGTQYPLKDYIHSYSNPVTNVYFTYSGSISLGDTVDLVIYNRSGQYTKTISATLTVS